MANRRANPVVLGFDFQVNAAIVLLLENITEMESVRLEGAHEDIEIELSDGRYVFAQAKAITKASSDFSNVRANLKKALQSLTEANEKAHHAADKLILITNSPNPLKDDQSRSCFWGPSVRDYDTLPPSAQKIISDYVNKLNLSIDLSLFRIQVVPFETDDYNERYKAVKSCTDSFIGRLNMNVAGLGDRLMEFWHHCLMANGGTDDECITLSKKEIIWPLIVLSTDIQQYDTGMHDVFDQAEYEEITRTYRQVIDHKCERYDFVSNVLYDFMEYKHDGPREKRMVSFITEQWERYSDDFDGISIDSDLRKPLIQIVLYMILVQRYQIDKIKRGVGL